MNGQELQSLFEAYIDVYAEQNLTEEITEYFSEEVEIASNYFYEMGLNEDGVDILIEDLGLEEFANFVYDIAEDYYLTERKLTAGETTLPASSRRRIGGKSAASRKFSDPEKTSTAGGKRRAARSAARKDNPPEETPRQKRIRELRVKAASNATEKQPKKPGVLDRIAGVVNKGIEAAQKRAASDVEKRKKFMSAARETGKVINKAARGAGQVAREVGRGASGATRLAGHVARQGLNNEYIMGYLIDEGYAETPEAAYAILVNMSEDWIATIVEEKLSALDMVRKKVIATHGASALMGTPENKAARKAAAEKAKKQPKPTSNRYKGDVYSTDGLGGIRGYRSGD